MRAAPGESALDFYLRLALITAHHSPCLHPGESLSLGGWTWKKYWIIDAARTPRAIGKIGKLAFPHSSQRLLSTVFRALEERNGLNTANVHDVIAGRCGSPSGKQGSCIGHGGA